MNQPISNPLAKHFRQPALHTKLISGGKYWPPGSIDLPMTGDIPVYPMTAKDEITLKTPDALMNGASVVEVIQSCCPNIKNAWQMPSIEVDNLLISVRIASYGALIPITGKCPKCGAEHDYDVSLDAVKAGIEMPDYDSLVDIGDELQAKLRPMSYQQISKSGMLVYEEQRLLQSLDAEGVSDEQKKAGYERHIDNLFKISVDNVTNSTEYIVSDGETVTDRGFIKEFYQNSGSNVMKKIQDRLAENAAVVNIKPVKVMCSDCGEPFALTIEFDYSSFFGKGF